MLFLVTPAGDRGGVFVPVDFLVLVFGDCGGDFIEDWRERAVLGEELAGELGALRDLDNGDPGVDITFLLDCLEIPRVPGGDMLNEVDISSPGNRLTQSFSM